MKDLVNFFWFLIKWGLLPIAAVALVAAPYLWQRMDEEIRRRVQSMFAQHYSQLAVSVRSAQLIHGEGIEIRGLSIFDPGVSGPQAELLYLDEMFVQCDTDLQKLVQNQLDIRRVVMRRLKLRGVRRPDGTWTSARLLPLPKFGDEPPITTIENASLELIDPQRIPTSSLVLRDGHVKVSPMPASHDTPGRTLMRIQGLAGGDHVRQIEFDGLFDPNGKSWQLAGTCEGLELSPDLCRAMPGPRPKSELPLEALRAQANAQFRVTYDSATTPALDYEVNAQLSRGRVDDSRLPNPLTELRGSLHCSPKGCQLTNFVARAGQSSVQLSLDASGFDSHSPMRIKVESRKLALDARLLDLFPEKWRAEWHKYLPSGEVDLDMTLDYDGQAWRPEVSLRCQNAAFTYHKFPFRLERARGSIEFKNQVLKVDLLAHADRAEVRILGEHVFGGPAVIGWLEVRGDNVRVDEKLILALPSKQAAIVRSLNPHGQFNIFYRQWRNREPEPPLHQHLVLNLHQATVRYEKFPYPVENVQGTVEMHDNAWNFRNLEGVNGTGRITCNGTLTPTPAGNELRLQLTGANVPLEEELRDALSPGAQQLWNDLKPRGTIDLKTDVTHVSGQLSPRVLVRAEPVGDTVSIEPAYFQYRLEGLRGTFVQSDGLVTFDRAKARHGATNVTTKGFCQLRPEGGWELRFEQLTIDQLRADRDLLQALSGRLKKLVGDLHLGGPVNVRGALGLASRGVPGDTLTADWDVNVDFQQGSLDCGLKLDNLHGSVDLAGKFDGRTFYSQGNVNLDCVTFRDFQFTEVRGPIWLDDTRFLVGFWADRMRGAQPERRLTAKLYGGTLLTDGWVTLGADPRYSFLASLAQGDLARWTQEALPGRQSLRGEIVANIELRGRGGGINNLGGRGSVQLRNADIYELPLMVSLLKLLSVREPDSTAFTKCDADFRIEGEHLYVDRIDFNGDAVSLLGKGEIGLNRQIRLTFQVVVGRAESRLPAVRELLGGASQQIMLIHADGTLDQPDLRRETFPGVSQALQQLQANRLKREEQPQ